MRNRGVATSSESIASIVVNFMGTVGDVLFARRRNVFSRPIRIAGGSHDDAQSGSVERVLPVRDVAFRHRLAGWAALPHVTGNANDRHGLGRIEKAKYRPADGVLSRKRFSNERFINHRDRGFVGTIAVVEVASALQWNSERSQTCPARQQKLRR